MADDTHEAPPAEGNEAPPTDADSSLPAETGEGGAPPPSGDVSWREGISDEKVRAFAERYTDPVKLAEASFAANQELSRRIKVPGEDASEDDLASFRKALGVPESPDKYALPRPEYLDDDAYALLEPTMQRVVANMHKTGATQASVDAALKTYFEVEQEAREAVAKQEQAATEEAEANLRKEWGADYKMNIAHAQQAMESFGITEWQARKLEGGQAIGNDPEFLRMMAQVGRVMGEGGLQAGFKGTEAGKDLQEQYDELTTQIHNAMDTGDRELARRLDAKRLPLSEKLHGTAKAYGSA